MAEKHGDPKNLNDEIDQLDPAKLGVSQDSLDAAKKLPDEVRQRIVTAEPADFCNGKACIVAAKVGDRLVNLESMTDLVVEVVGGALINAGVDTYKIIKAGGKASEEVVDVSKTFDTNISIAAKADGDMVGMPEVKLDLPAFETKGLKVERPQDIPEGQAMIDEYMKMGASRADAIEYTKSAIASGTDIPIVRIIDEPLYKVVPKDAPVSGHTIFWMTRSELDILIEHPELLAKNSGLPLQSNAVVYDVYKIIPKVPAKVFESKIADTVQGAYKQEATATQILVPDRSQFTDAKKTFELGGVR